MQIKQSPIPLSSSSSSDSYVKQGALAFFRAVHVIADYAAEIPDAAVQAGHDIAEAWEESSRPNVR